MTKKSEPYKRKTLSIPPDLMIHAVNQVEELNLDNFNDYVKWLIRFHKKNRELKSEQATE